MNKRLLRLSGGVLILLGSLLLVAGIILSLFSDSYKAIVRLRVDPDAINPISPSTKESIPFDPYWIQDEFEILQSKSILYQVITNLNLKDKWAEDLKAKGELRIDAAYARLRNKIEVRKIRGASLLEIEVRTEDANEAAVIANEIADVYRHWRLDRWNEARTELLPLRAELEKLNQAITHKQAEMEALKASSQTNGADGSELEELKQKRDALKLTILHQWVDEGGHRSGPVRIVDQAEPPLRPRYPRETLAMVAFLTGVGAIALGAVLLAKGYGRNLGHHPGMC